MKCHATLLLFFWVGGYFGSCISAISAIHHFHHPLLHFDGCLDYLEANCTRNIQDLASRAHNFPREERESIMPKSSKENVANVYMMEFSLKSSVVPTISTRATSSSIPQLPKYPHPFSSEIDALAGIIQGFQWHEIIFLHQDSQSSNQFSSQLIDAFKDKEILISNKISISSSITYFSTLKILSKISQTQTRMILLHVTDVTLGSQLVLAAKELGLMSIGYAWLITSRMSNMLNSMDQNSVNILEGIVGIRPHLFQISSTQNSHVKSDNIPRGHSSNIMHLLSNDSLGEFSMSFEVFNVLGKVERVVGYWNPHFGFSRELGAIDDVKDLNSVKNFKKIIWPGDSTMVPRCCDVPKAIRLSFGPWRGILR
ncbi:hypothetical protein Leryth_012287 [Lithospermum erythrorhizon]|nr:hypothetical protein Leryth_012287 [Lithospermum erythrorhizon]